MKFNVEIAPKIPQRWIDVVLGLEKICQGLVRFDLDSKLFAFFGCFKASFFCFCGGGKWRDFDFFTLFVNGYHCKVATIAMCNKAVFNIFTNDFNPHFAAAAPYIIHRGKKNHK